MENRILLLFRFVFAKIVTSSFIISEIETGSFNHSPRRKIENNHILQNNEQDLDLLLPKIKESKTKVQITINGENVYWIKIPKPANYITLADIKNQLLSKPRIYGITTVNGMMYDYYVKTIKNGKTGLEECDEDTDNLPLFGDKIELECWSKQ